MEQTINLQAFLQAGAALIALWGFYKVKACDKAVADIQEERQKIVELYDGKLQDLENRINENYTGTENQIRELKEELFILTKSVAAILDGLKQQGCNGAVTEAKKELDQFLMGKAYD